MSELERVLQRLARLLRGEEQLPSAATTDLPTIIAPGDPGADRSPDPVPERKPGAAPA